MSQSLGDTTHLLNLLRAGDESAREALICHAWERLRTLSSQMLKGYRVLQGVEETDDVLQNALIRLDSALRAESPESGRHFFNLASLQIERALKDLARHYRGRSGKRPRQLTGQEETAGEEGGLLQSLADSTGEPTSLAEWTEFHERVERLPQRDQEVFGLLYYQGLGQEDAAAVLGVSLRTVKRRWHRARCLLCEALGGERPAFSG
jgi:RNA polymerase sigma-70 factor (ECF subfamily)